MQYDAVIVGAGHDGLTCAAYLARAGRRVLVVEWRGLVRFLTGSLGELLGRRFVSDKLKRRILANSLYGKQGGPFQPGAAMGLLFHLPSGGDAQQQAWQRDTSSAGWVRSQRRCEPPAWTSE